MTMDQPVIDYGGKKKKKMMATRSEVEELDELTELWNKNREGRTFIGTKVDLNDFIANKI